MKVIDFIINIIQSDRVSYNDYDKVGNVITNEDNLNYEVVIRGSH